MRRVQLAGEAGAWINLGTSRERYESISGWPTLAAQGFRVRTEAGEELLVEPGTAVGVSTLYGARRNVLSSTTAPEGVIHVFSFEVAAGTWLWVRGRVEGTASARLEGPRILRPAGGRIRISGEPLGPLPLPGGATPGCWWFLLVPVTGASAAAVYFEWTTVWWIVAAVGTLLLVMGLLVLPTKVSEDGA